MGSISRLAYEAATVFDTLFEKSRYRLFTGYELDEFCGVLQNFTANGLVMPAIAVKYAVLMLLVQQDCPHACRLLQQSIQRFGSKLCASQVQ